MKSYTGIEQSKELAEILPLESADMWFHPHPNDEYWYDVPNLGNADFKFNQLPCWSLAALLDFLPNSQGQCTKSLYWFDVAWHCEYVDEDGACILGTSADNALDACVEMILKLHKLNLL